MTVSEYLDWWTYHLSFLSLSIVIWLQEKDVKKEVGWFVILVAGRCLDFALRGSEGFFTIGFHAVSYDTIMFLVFGLIILQCKSLKSG
jgi:hypothetical protein